MRTYTFYKKEVSLYDAVTPGKGQKLSSPKFAQEWIMTHPEESEWIVKNAKNVRILTGICHAGQAGYTRLVGDLTEEQSMWYTLRFK